MSSIIQYPGSLANSSAPTLVSSTLIDALAGLLQDGSSGIVSMLSAEAPVLAVDGAQTKFTLLDAASGEKIKARATGISIAQDTVLGGRKYIAMPGTTLGQMRTRFQIPQSYTFIAALKMPSVTTSYRVIFSQPLALAAFARGGKGYLSIAHGSQTINTLALVQTANQEGIFTVSYDAVAQTMTASWNTLDPITPASMTNTVPVSPFTEYGGINTGGTDLNPFTPAIGSAFFVDRALHATANDQELRRQVVDYMADYYGITLAG